MYAIDEQHSMPSGRAAAASEDDQQPRFERFSASGLWARRRACLQRSDEVPHYITSTAGTASCYAEAILSYWQAALAAGDVDPDEPLMVLELGAGCGRLTYLLQRALNDGLERLRARRAKHVRLRLLYVASDDVEGNLAFIAAHPYLLPEVQAGRLDTALWDAEAGGALRLRSQRRQLASAANPLVVIANHVFDGLNHDLFGVHYGRLLEGQVAATISDNGSDTDLAFDWRPLDAADWLPLEEQQLLARYAAKIDHGAMLFPVGPLRCLAHIDELAACGYLLLSADKGVTSLQDLRNGACQDIAFHGSLSVPVNYPLIADVQRARGIQVWHGCHREDGLVYHLSLRGGPQYVAVFDEIRERLDTLNPDDYFTLKKSVETLGGALAPEQLLALLRLGRYDYRILALMIDPLIEHGTLSGTGLRNQWRQALARSWRQYFPLGETDGFHHHFGLLAARLSAFGLAADASRLGLWMHGDDPDTLTQLALCEAAVGRLDEACAAAEHAAVLDGTLARQGLSARMKERRLARDLLLGGQPAATDDDLRLEPLQIEHAAALLEQYRDPQIGVMTRLPELNTLEQAVEWIVEQRHERGNVTCAVLHEHWGFVGAVNLRRHQDAAYFYFWIGTDFQGLGQGRRAATLLLNSGAARDLGAVFTSAYSDNRRSRTALASLEFAQLPVSAAAPDDDLLFFRRALSNGGSCAMRDDPAAYAAALDQLLRGIDSPIKLTTTSAPEAVGIEGGADGQRIQ